jgi:hypothetical protein
MKTRTLVLTTLCLLVTAHAAPAQAFYYDETRTFHEDGFTYQCDNDGGNVTLYNKLNRLTYVDKTYKDGRELPEEIYRGRVHEFEDERWTRPKADSIARHSFSTQEKALLGDWRYGIDMRINPGTGRVDEVIFYFPARSPYGRVPPSTYYKIEQALKRDLRFTVTEAGKQLNYIQLVWSQEVN